ncbi:hypothetical protein BDR26DRAFT_667069, partial [Obelidium mucronatum]
ELVNIDLKTWVSEKYIRENYLTEFERLSEVYHATKFGNTDRKYPSPSYNFYTPELLWLIEGESCLPYNKDACKAENRKWDYSIGYTPNAVGLGMCVYVRAYSSLAESETQGLLHLTDYTMSLHMDLAHYCETGPFKPPSESLQFFEKVLEWDYLDGWHHIEEHSYVETIGMLKNSVNLNIAIFVLEMVLVFFGQFLVVSRMMSNFKFTDQCIFDLLNRLPPQVKNVPEIAELLVHNGIMAKPKNGTNQVEEINNKDTESKPRSSVTNQLFSVITFGGSRGDYNNEKADRKVSFISPRISVAGNTNSVTESRQFPRASRSMPFSTSV